MQQIKTTRYSALLLLLFCLTATDGFLATNRNNEVSTRNFFGNTLRQRSSEISGERKIDVDGLRRKVVPSADDRNRRDLSILDRIVDDSRRSSRITTTRDIPSTLDNRQRHTRRSPTNLQQNNRRLYIDDHSRRSFEERRNVQDSRRLTRTEDNWRRASVRSNELRRDARASTGRLQDSSRRSENVRNIPTDSSLQRNHRRLADTRRYVRSTSVDGQEARRSSVDRNLQQDRAAGLQDASRRHKIVDNSRRSFLASDSSDTIRESRRLVDNSQRRSVDVRRNVASIPERTQESRRSVTSGVVDNSRRFSEDSRRRNVRLTPEDRSLTRRVLLDNARRISNDFRSTRRHDIRSASVERTHGNNGRMNIVDNSRRSLDDARRDIRSSVDRMQESLRRIQSRVLLTRSRTDNRSGQTERSSDRRSDWALGRRIVDNARRASIDNRSVRQLERSSDTRRDIRSVSAVRTQESRHGNIVDNSRRSRVDERRALDGLERAQTSNRRIETPAERRQLRFGNTKDENNNERQSQASGRRLATSSETDYAPNIKLDALVNAAKIVLVTFLVAQIVNNSSKTKRNWLNTLTNFVTVTKEKVL